MASVCAFPFTATVDSFFSVCAPRSRRIVLKCWHLRDWSDSDCWNHRNSLRSLAEMELERDFFTVSLEGGSDYSNHSTLPSTRGRVDIVVKLTWNLRPQRCPPISEMQKFQSAQMSQPQSCVQQFCPFMHELLSEKATFMFRLFSFPLNTWYGQIKEEQQASSHERRVWSLVGLDSGTCTHKAQGVFEPLPFLPRIIKCPFCVFF